MKNFTIVSLLATLGTVSQVQAATSLSCQSLNPQSIDASARSQGNSLFVSLGSQTETYSCPTAPEVGSSVRCTQNQLADLPPFLRFTVNRDGTGDIFFAPTPGAGQIPPLDLKSCK